MPSNVPIHSTGRGGAGNIGPHGNTYVDGDIVREGAQGVSPAPEYSAGRGGAGNMVHPTSNQRSEEIVPESATRTIHPGDGYENYHTGRGGEGNVHKEKYGGHSKPQKGDAEHKDGLLDKVKNAIGGGKRDKTPERK